MGGDNSKLQNANMAGQAQNQVAPEQPEPSQALKPVSLDKQKEKEKKNKDSLQNESNKSPKSSKPELVAQPQLEDDLEEPNPDEILNYVPKKLRENKIKEETKPKEVLKPVEKPIVEKDKVMQIQGKNRSNEIDDLKDSIIDLNQSKKSIKVAKVEKVENSVVKEEETKVSQVEIPQKREEDDLINYFNNVEEVEKPKPKQSVQNDLFAVDVTKFRAAQMAKDDEDNDLFKPVK